MEVCSKPELRWDSVLTFLLSRFCLSVGSRACWLVKSLLACLVNSLAHLNAMEETINFTVRKLKVSLKSSAVLVFSENASGQCMVQLSPGASPHFTSHLQFFSVMPMSLQKSSQFSSFLY